MIPCNEDNNYYCVIHDLENKENKKPEGATLSEIKNDNLEPISVSYNGGRSNYSNMLYSDNEEKEAHFSERNTVVTGSFFII